MSDVDAMLREAADDSSALYNKGLVFLESDRFPEARAAFDLIKDPGLHAKALLPHAAACYWSDDASTAAELLRGQVSSSVASGTTSVGQSCYARLRRLSAAKTRSSPCSNKPWSRGPKTRDSLR